MKGPNKPIEPKKICANLNVVMSTDKPCPLKQQLHLARQGPVHANRGLLDAINEVKA